MFLSDVPADTTEHGSFFVMAHFHYTIMGGLIFAFIAGDLLLAAEDDRDQAERDGSGKIHFWTMFIFFNSTFLPLFALGLLGMPRRVFDVRAQPGDAQRLGLDLRVLPGRLRSLDLPGQLRHVHAGLARAGSRQPVAGAQPGMAGATPPPPENFKRVPVILSGPMTTACQDARCRWPTSTPPPGVIAAAYAGAPGAEAQTDDRHDGVSRHRPRKLRSPPGRGFTTSRR